MNKIERMKAVFKGETPDVTPAGFWFHYDGKLSVKEIADSHLELYNKTNMDIIKVMQDYPYPSICEVKSASDWSKIKMAGKKSPEFEKLSEVLKRILDATNGETMVFQTMFGPFKAAAIAYGDALLMEHSKENPKAVASGVAAISEALTEWAEGYLDIGASGIYYSAQFGETDRFTKEEWEMLVKPYDIQVLGVAAKRENKYNILHICGEPDYDFKVSVDRFADYPADIVNWSVKDNGLSLMRGREMFKKPILGGLNNKGNLINGTEEQINKEVNDVISSFGQAGLMIGADCTVQGKIDIEKIRMAVSAAHSYNG